MGRSLRYFAPNAITAMGVLFGWFSLVATSEGRYTDAAWWIIYAVLSDRLDGFVARLVNGASRVGVQLDSLADFFNFGVCPAFLVSTALINTQEVALQTDVSRPVVAMCSITWVFAAAFRLARFNVEAEDRKARVFYGVPTTLAACLLVLWFLVLQKYGEPGLAWQQEFQEAHLLGSFRFAAAAWRLMPALLVLGAVLMSSHLRVPKMTLVRSKAISLGMILIIASGYAFGLLRLFPEYLIAPPLLWLVILSTVGCVSPHALPPTVSAPDSE